MHKALQWLTRHRRAALAPAVGGTVIAVLITLWALPGNLGSVQGQACGGTIPCQPCGATAPCPVILPVVNPVIVAPVATTVVVTTAPVTNVVTSNPAQAQPTVVSSPPPPPPPPPPPAASRVPTTAPPPPPPPPPVASVVPPTRAPTQAGINVQRPAAPSVQKPGAPVVVQAVPRAGAVAAAPAARPALPNTGTGPAHSDSPLGLVLPLSIAAALLAGAGVWTLRRSAR